MPLSCKTGLIKQAFFSGTSLAAGFALEDFKDKWGSKYPDLQVWEANWANLSGFFKYPDEMRRLIYPTNAVKGFHLMLRKFTQLMMP